VPGDERLAGRILFVAETADETTVIKKNQRRGFSQELLF
jgi:hypothetical protein